MRASAVKLAFHGADTDTDNDTDSPNTARVLTSDTRYFLARIVARMSVSVPVSASWNVSYTDVAHGCLSLSLYARWSLATVSRAKTAEPI